jgi:hypothetical protein
VCVWVQEYVPRPVSLFLRSVTHTRLGHSCSWTVGLVIISRQRTVYREWLLFDLHYEHTSSHIVSCLVPNTNMTFVLFTPIRERCFFVIDLLFRPFHLWIQPTLLSTFCHHDLYSSFLMLDVHKPLRGGMTLGRSFLSPFL